MLPRRLAAFSWRIRPVALRWQPNADASLMLYNMVADQALHVLNTHNLDLQTHAGGGTHSNMVVYDDDRWLVATDHLGEGTRIRVVDRSSKRVLSETAVGSWGHGVTVVDLKNAESNGSRPAASCWGSLVKSFDFCCLLQLLRGLRYHPTNHTAMLPSDILNIFFEL